MWIFQYFPPVNSLSKQKRTMRRGMKKTCILTVRRYAAHLIDLNKYLTSFPGSNMTDKIGVTELDEFLLNIIRRSIYKDLIVSLLPLKSCQHVEAHGNY